MTKPDMPAPAPIWTVTGQAEDSIINDAGRAVNGVKISFTTPAGDTGTVFVPNAAYSVDNVRAAIAAKVATMLGISALNG